MSLIQQQLIKPLYSIKRWVWLCILYKSCDPLPQGGNTASALELCFQYDRFELLEQVVKEIDVQSDTSVVDRCVQFFTSHGELEKAINLLVKIGKVCTIH